MAINTYFNSVTSFICAGQYAAIVQYWGADSAELTGNPFLDAQALNTAFEDGSTSLLENLAAVLSEDCFISSVRSRRVTGAGPTAITSFAAGDYPGAYSGNLDAFQTAAVVIWSQGGSNAKHGRSFIPGVSAEALSGNRFFDAYQTALQFYIDDVVDGITDGSVNFVPVLRVNYPLATAYVPITGGYLSPTPGAIKARRLPV